MSDTSIRFDAVLDLCRDRHRRIALAALAAERRPLAVTDLAETVVECVPRSPTTEASGDEVAAVRRSLYHVHLPKLAAAGFVTFDPECELVEPAEGFDRVESVLSTTLDADPELETPIEL